MIREIIRPTSKKLVYNLPKEYINKEIEIIIFPFSEIKQQSKQKTENNFIDKLSSNPIALDKSKSFFSRDEANER